MRLVRKSLSFQTGPASPKATVIGMAFAASVMLILTIIVAKIAYDLDFAGQPAQGEVIQLIKADEGMQRAVFQFVDSQGQTHTVDDDVQTSYKKYEIGEKVALVYRQDDPSGARTDGVPSLYFVPLILGLMSLLFYAGAALVWRFQPHFQKEYEARRGRTIVTTVNNDGSSTQATYNSAPVFRWTGMLLAGLGVASVLGAFWFTSYSPAPNERSLNIIFVPFFIVVGGLLLLGAMASLKHAKFLQKLEEPSRNLDSN